ncbi:YjbH domain-containing protein [Neogemmobacter tilapiae]|uniref:YjbH domain-containing protein n=1 Tax=Neogemmobacter tilapiae TaxID=875041 RepID=A0A918WIF3_9RHOB|nr:YjbH domain-containing protein [Gemmobacter tilapiae]GHC50435.1 hypothetical protein GCM10007315_10920 [Gemmobacter tilapiae]
MTRRHAPTRRARLAASTAVVAFAAHGALAEGRPSLNFYGVTGLIDMPSAEQQHDGAFTASTAHFGPISRHTLTFQITPRLSGSFRYQGVRDFNAVVPSKFDTYFDRSFDLRYQVLREGEYRPSVTVGLQDFVGTGLFAGEYVVATKNIGDDLKVTAGLGWGRLGSYGSIGQLFGDRPAIDIDRGGKINFGQWFQGDAAPFAGVEYRFNDHWSVKAEYSSDAYDMEATNRQTFDRNSPFNFGIEYRKDDAMQLGAYYMYGSQLGLAAHFFINPAQRPMGGVRDTAPFYVKPRPSRSADPDAWSPEWVSQPGIAPVLIKNVNSRVEDDGIVVEGISFTATTATVLIRNPRNDAEAQAIGRVARAMSQIMPASVEYFEIVPVVNGMKTSKVTVRRSDLEQLDYAVGGDAAMLERVTFADVPPNIAGLELGEELYPKFAWSLAPYMKTRLFDPTNPYRAEIGAKLSGNWDIAPGLVASGALTYPIAGNLGDGRGSDSVLPLVRSDGVLYDRDQDLDINNLTLAYHRQLSPNLYGRVTVGYLESMFGGVSTEVLWKKVDSPFALGVEVNYAKKREYDQMFGFQDYDVVTGHVSGYYAFGRDKNYLAQLDVGRYLAGDYGATLTLNRTFENGWRFGVFATLTDVPFEDFGEGSFDKGIIIEIPVNWFLGSPNRRSNVTTIRPLSRDGGARLKVDGRLYDLLSDYQQVGIEDQWGRFWK